MRIFCCFTPAHEVLFRTIFLPSVPEGFQVESTGIEIGGRGDFLSEEFLQCIQKKINLVVRSISDHPGEVIVWSDVDIRFFNLSPAFLRSALGTRDMMFQRESMRMQDVNTGFIVFRCTEIVRRFFTEVENAQAHPRENEQMVINRLLFSGSWSTLVWDYLPPAFYARTQGWPPPRKLALYHANYTKGNDGIGQKLSQFREMEGIHRGGMAAWLWSIARRLPGCLSRP